MDEIMPLAEMKKKKKKKKKKKNKGMWFEGVYKNKRKVFRIKRGGE